MTTGSTNHFTIVNTTAYTFANGGLTNTTLTVSNVSGNPPSSTLLAIITPNVTSSSNMFQVISGTTSTVTVTASCTSEDATAEGSTYTLSTNYPWIS